MFYKSVYFEVTVKSSRFQVTTRRTQGAEKAVIPCEDDPVNKLPGVGKETHAKLKNLQAAGLDYPLPNYHITRGTPHLFLKGKLKIIVTHCTSKYRVTLVNLS